ncbi:Molybdopterin or thiamine biosynthesis adenylyltransferase [Nannocystis exedens]|uniref:Molybdopterin-synthase adenylyltransferase n=1 Tax=Nannocystis exedens TaxID=54 RepID=A0A1I2F6V2_9BACT|nr:molybdopterin-synthase adenylyltransferase MoeB [Nannocystis exedens]PCC73078.1 molybdopterin biosynthesis protein MoeB [Nannocystis exedens]SFF00567.1 Molybdopterin or thiamine biosynthesis adenylyltransferase [Nannocystis exedens]
MASFNEILSQVKRQVREVSVEDTRARVHGAGGEPPPVLVDIRERDEYEQGFIGKAEWIPRGFLELKIEDLVPERNREVILYCAGGTRSALAARSLQELGYERVSSMAGGFRAWKQAGYAFERPRNLSAEQIKRYSRHIMLPEVGELGQGKLLDAKVLCLGAGGLGSPSSLYLAAAGVGTIGMVDDDLVDESNLQRQILHNMERLGLPKVESARKTLQALNPDVKVVAHQTRLTSENVLDIIGGYDVIVDGADNFPTRYLLNDAALKLGKPVVHASIFRFEGQLTTFLPHEGPCYRCLYPDPPPPGMAPSCQEAGVLGVLPGIIGTLQANEALKIILGVGQTLSGRLLVFDALGTKWRTLKLRKDPECRVCSKKPEEIELIDYEAFCSIAG